MPPARNSNLISVIFLLSHVDNQRFLFEKYEFNCFVVILNDAVYIGFGASHWINLLPSCESFLCDLFVLLIIQYTSDKQ